ncbi:MAG: DUF2461 domain-containing protein [Bacteroidota bacterium]|nr:DUF2461 domain-containing protein [Bacteroidota bacterium]
MYKQDTLLFLKNLQENNNKAWFDEHRKEYETAKADNLANADIMLKAIANKYEAAAEFSPKKAIFRINRDIRFSANKDPYKNNMGVFYQTVQLKDSAPGFYLHIQNDASFIAVGVYGPSAQHLKLIRQEIDYNLADFKKIIEAKSFTNIFSSGLSTDGILSRPPKGYEKDNPALEYLKLKSFVASHSITNTELCSPAIDEFLNKYVEVSTPLLQFLESAYTNADSSDFK